MRVLASRLSGSKASWLTSFLAVPYSFFPFVYQDAETGQGLKVSLEESQQVVKHDHIGAVADV
ncbi:hypothetical protein GCM10023186_08530 [Hymenobacter koreensis]|uniref:Uncharacterized protein n=1 Tax=Hymenobacter koreensis TaxID=1084523 RepID=A0ABP8IVH2_9BACT